MLVEPDGEQRKHALGVKPMDCMRPFAKVQVWTASPWPENNDSSHVFPCDEQKLLQLTPGVPFVHDEGGGGGGRGEGGGWGGGGHSYPANPISVMHEQVPQSTFGWAAVILEEKSAARKTNTTAKSRAILLLNFCHLWLVEEEVTKGEVARPRKHGELN